MYGGYVGKILKVNLTTGKTATLDTFRYAPDFIGGIGLGYRLLWDETNEGTTEWSPENPVIFASGPCCGTPAPTTGRAEIIGLAPQGYPVAWAAVSGFGGDFGPKMKFAGFDAIVVTGKAASPKYLYVSEGKTELVDAGFLWGLTSYSTQDILLSTHGDDVSIACIGPAGENRVRWATIMSSTRNAAGQGGFGAVMGDKNLKAVVIKPGSVRIPVAHPDKLLEEVKKISGELSPAGQNRNPLSQDMGRYSTRRASCAYAGCTGGVNGCLPAYYSGVPMKYTGYGSMSGSIYCAGGAANYFMLKDGYSPEVNFEISKLLDQLGLNSWEAFVGMNWFIQNCFNAGKLTRLMGETLELSRNGPAVYPKTGVTAGFSAELAVKLLRGVAYREGEGDIWAEGAARASEALGLSEELWKTHKHGYGPHWDGRHLHFIHYPVWVYSALSWAVQGRDPFNQEHGYVERYPSFVSEWSEKTLWDTPTITYREMCAAGAKIYGARHANSGWDDPENGYTDKEYPVFWHNHRAIIKSSLPVCDRQFPLLYDASKPDKIGDIDAEVRIFNAVVGTDWSMDDMNKAAERAFNVMRALHVRQGRGRHHDESVIRYFEQPANWPDEPGPQTIDTNRFLDLMDRFYLLRGWDKNTGRPTRAKLAELGLEDIAEGLEKKIDAGGRAER